MFHSPPVTFRVTHQQLVGSLRGVWREGGNSKALRDATMGESEVIVLLRARSDLDGSDGSRGGP